MTHTQYESKNGMEIISYNMGLHSSIVEGSGKYI